MKQIGTIDDLIKTRRMVDREIEKQSKGDILNFKHRTTSKNKKIHRETTRWI